jgi:HK97 family phage major capsid protein
MTLETGTGLGAAVTPKDYVDFYFDRLSASSVGLRSGFTVIPTDKKEIPIPKVTADPQASWVEEGGKITESEPSGESTTAKPRKLAALSSLTREVWQDSEPAALAIAENTMVRSMGLKLDLGFYEGSGTAPEPRGLKNVSGIQVVDMGTNGAALTNLDPIADAIGMLEGANAEATAIVMHPTRWKELSKLKELTTGSNKPLLEQAGAGTNRIQRSIYGKPVYLTSQISTTETQGTSSNASSIYVYEAEQIVVVRRQDVELDVDPFFKFDEDEIGVRAISRWDITVPNAAAVVRIRGTL